MLVNTIEPSYLKPDCTLNQGLQTRVQYGRIQLEQINNKLGRGMFLPHPLGRCEEPKFLKGGHTHTYTHIKKIKFPHLQSQHSQVCKVGVDNKPHHFYIYLVICLFQSTLLLLILNHFIGEKNHQSLRNERVTFVNLQYYDAHVIQCG